MATMAVSAGGGPAADVQSKLDDGGERRDVYVTMNYNDNLFRAAHAPCGLIVVVVCHNQPHLPR